MIVTLKGLCYYNGTDLFVIRKTAPEVSAMPKPYSKATKDLQGILNQAKSPEELNRYLKELKESEGKLRLCDYLNEMLAKKNLRISDIQKNILYSESYLRNLFNGHRTNPDRMKLIGVCIGAHMTLPETQRALEIAGKGILYPRNEGDAIIIYNINRENWSITDINIQLQDKGLPIIE